MKARVPYLRMITLERAINDHGKGYKASIGSTKSKDPSRKNVNRLEITKGGKLIYVCDLGLGHTTRKAVCWIDENLGTDLQARMKEAHKARVPHKRARRELLIDVRDERGLTVRIRTRAGEEIEARNVTQVEVER